MPLCRARGIPGAIGLAALTLLLWGAPARADVGVVLNDSVSHGMARITGAGHSGVYFSRICPASPVKLRLCFGGEKGSVLSTYSDFGEDDNYEWNVVPLQVYLYGVQGVSKRPLLASERVKEVLESQYEDAYLAAHCTGPSCTDNRKGQWRAMVGAMQIRTVYIFVVSTTVEEDLAFLEQFNARPNEGRFNGFTRNCADFAREIINSYFPKAVRRNFLNDFGMSSPKEITRSFAKFAHGNPERQYHVMYFPQVPGVTKRSSPARAGTEQLVRSKKLLIPVLLLQAPAAGISAVTYLFTGRFNAQRERERYPTAQATELERERRLAEERKDEAAVEELTAALRRARDLVLGTAWEWNQYREEFAGLLADAEQTGLIASPKALAGVFKSLDTQGRPVRDEDGMWLEIQKDGGTMRVGLSAENIVSEESDPTLSYRLMLARVNEALSRAANARPAKAEFERDWELLQQAREKAEVWQGSTARK